MFAIIEAVITWLLSPLGKALTIFAVVGSILGGVYLKGRSDDNKSFKENIQRESVKAVAKTTAARNTATQRFDAGRVRDDGFARD